jgi:hypothetical protein
MDVIQPRRRTLTRDEIIQELVELLKHNNMNQHSNDLFEICSYVDSLEKKLDSMTEELSLVREQIKEMKEDTSLNNLKKYISEAANRLAARCNAIKEQVGVVKENIRSKAADIMKEVKVNGRAALNRVSEFFGIKEKLTIIREHVKEGIVDTDKTIAKIDAFGAGIREANQQIVNTFRTFADKPIMDYTQKERGFSKVEFAKKPWELQKKVYQSMILHLDGGIDKVDALSKKTEIDKMMKIYDDIFQKSKQETAQIVLLVSGEKVVYGADAFEASIGKQEKQLGVNQTQKTRCEKSR